MRGAHLKDARATGRRLGAPDHPARYLRARLSRPHVLATALTLIASGALVAGCGRGAQQRQAQKLEKLGIVSNTAPLSERLVTQAEVNSTSDKAASQTLLHMWSLLQFAASDRAEEMFEPELRKLIGYSLLTAALEGELVTWQATKPKIVSASVTNGTATIRFLTLDETGKVRPASISFRGGEGKWRVAYFSLLSRALQRAAQASVQARVDPLATKPSAEAVRQGYEASGILGVYLERQARAGHPV